MVAIYWLQIVIWIFIYLLFVVLNSMDYGLKTWLASYRWSHSSCNWRAWGFRFISIPIGMNSRTRIGSECVLGWMLLVHLTCWVNIQGIVKQIQEWLCNCCCCWQILCNHHHHHLVMLLCNSSSMCVLNWTTSICKWSVHGATLQESRFVLLGISPTTVSSSDGEMSSAFATEIIQRVYLRTC